MLGMGPSHGRLPPGPRLIGLWWPPALLFFALMALWGLATPLAAAPDEPAHILRAVSLDHGQLLGPSVTGSGMQAYTHVTVPSTYAQIIESPTCYQFKSTQTARCIPKITPSSKPTAAVDYTGRYLPLYYAVVGLPSLVTDKIIGFHMMRLISAILDASLLGMAVATARKWSHSALLPAGIAIAATPMCFFLAGVVNPSGFEICAAIAMWTAAVVLVTDYLADPPTALVWVIAATAASLALARADSPLWLALAAVVLAPIYVRRGTASLFRRRDVRSATSVVIVALALSLGWTLSAHALDVVPAAQVPDISLLRAIADQFGALPETFVQEIGLFGWLDTPAPWLTMIAWYVLTGAALTPALLRAPWRRGLAVALIGAAAVLMPVLLGVATYRHNGLIGQGRYSLPAAVGLPILALSWIGQGSVDLRLTARAGRAIATVIAVAQFLSFYYALRRYRVGTNGPMFGSGNLPPSAIWSPPLGTIPIEALFLLGCLTFGISIGKWSKAETRIQSGTAAALTSVRTP
jgi:hypothetical protein